ncbi:hypothetical protein ACFSUS_18240 [Spirosoma soli]|uniref:Outer membrane protein beta-barrel domain-containing protein n=1 Tax=Spirosoma soli TaxID=1770529 RepID=A0ABW5M6G7_9BACT
MKKLFVTVLAAGMTTASFCQKTFILSHQDKKGFFALSAGASLPVGQFASCSPINEKAGMADRGVAFSLSAGYRLVGPVGVMVRGAQYRNALQAHALLNNVYRNETDVWTAKADDWSVNTIMGGPYVSIPMGRFSVDANVLAGQATAVLPNTAINGNFGQVEMAVKTTGAQSTATAYGGGVTVRYRLGRSLSLHMNSDYVRSQFKFDNLTSTAWSSNGRSESSSYSSDRIVSVVSVSAGVSILFGNGNRPF